MNMPFKITRRHALQTAATAAIMGLSAKSLLDMAVYAAVEPPTGTGYEARRRWMLEAFRNLPISPQPKPGMPQAVARLYLAAGRDAEPIQKSQALRLAVGRSKELRRLVGHGTQAPAGVRGRGLERHQRTTGAQVAGTIARRFSRRRSQASVERVPGGARRGSPVSAGQQKRNLLPDPTP
jgi:hypothetical protein